MPEMHEAVKDVEARPTSRRQDAYETILNAIVFGDLAPGSRLDEKSLAHDFGIGIAGVRDALLRLSLERLVTRQARIGTTVAGLEVQELQDVFEARIIVECQCARIAALRADTHDLQILNSLVKEYKEVAHVRDFRKLFTVDREFHSAVARATRNRLLESQVVVLHHNASRFWYFGIARLEQDDLKKSMQSHIDVVKAISDRDPTGAESAMQAAVGDFPGFAEHYLKNRQVYGSTYSQTR